MTRPKGALREGFTTGTAAAAAAKAATLLLTTGWRGERVDVPLPVPGRLGVDVAELRLEGDGARAAVIKDAGDDPDATHGARIECFVRLEKDGGDARSADRAAPCPDAPFQHGPLGQGRQIGHLDHAGQRGEDAQSDHVDQADRLDQAASSRRCPVASRPRPPGPAGGIESNRIIVEGGRGVGRATLPGLPIEPGEAAINPAPRRQIMAAVAEALEAAGLDVGASVLVEVPDGAALAARTLNPRLGIVGGISILGTSGIVKPYSHAAWEATIREGLDVARAVGFEEVFLTTGRRSERFLLALRPEVSATAMVQAADHFGLATAEAAGRGFASIAWCLFFGKLAKQAQGLANTHAKEAAVDFSALAGMARSAGLEEERASAVARAHTALQAQGIIRRSEAGQAALRAVARAGLAHMRRHAGPGPTLSYYLFDFDGELLLREQDAP